MNDLNDPEFGLMRSDGAEWILERRVSFNGTEVPVRVESESEDASGPSPVQRQAIQAALSLPSDVLELSAPVVVQNYDVYREMIGDDELRPLASPVDVWQSVQPVSIDIPAHYDITTPTFLLMAECGWDQEHGLVVRFRNGIADESDQQGEIGI